MPPSAATRIRSRIGSVVSPPVRAGPGIAMSGLVTAWAAWLSSASVVRAITVTGCPRCEPIPPGDACLEAELEAVVAALGGTALIRHLGRGAVGQVPARAHRGGDRLHIAAGFGIDPSRQPRHPVRALPPQQ